MTEKTVLWLKALVAANVTGACSALLSALGITGAQTVGVQVTQLDPKQLLAIVIAGAVVGGAAYLKQSPVPPE
jgi:hypothetical protein